MLRPETITHDHSAVTAPINILVVDDIPQNLIALEALLARPAMPNIALLKAASGAEALELLLVHEVALALVDVQMPGMDGFEVLERLQGKETWRDVPVIIVTAKDLTREDVERLVASGAEGHLAPWDAFWGHRYAVVRDPDGNDVDLFAALPG